MESDGDDAGVGKFRREYNSFAGVEATFALPPPPPPAPSQLVGLVPSSLLPPDFAFHVGFVPRYIFCVVFLYFT